MKPIQTVGIIGLGSLGVTSATLFTRALGAERVLVLADSSRIARYREEGFGATARSPRLRYVDAAARTSRWTYRCSPSSSAVCRTPSRPAATWWDRTRS